VLACGNFQAQSAIVAENLRLRRHVGAAAPPSATSSEQHGSALA
jgi:hypothetical protein